MELDSSRVVEKRIVGFHQDDEGHWVAELECGHNQHVRHNPPLVVRPWVQTPQGRARVLGRALDCKKCDRGEPADSSAQTDQHSRFT